MLVIRPAALVCVVADGGLEELDTQGVLLPEDLSLALLDEDLEGLDHELAVEPVEV